MICPRCGTINPDDTERCTRCQGSLAPPPPREKVPAVAEEARAQPAVASGVPAPEPAAVGEGSDAIEGIPWSSPTPGAWPAPPETPTWPPPWPAPTAPPPRVSPPEGPPAPWPPPPSQTGPWGPPPTGPPVAPPGQWPAPPPNGQWQTPPPPGQWPAPPPPAPYPPPGQWPPPAPPPPAPGRRDTSRPNYLPWAVVCTILFNLIGVVAIVYCVVANRRFAAGDVDGGMRATRLAKTWCWVSVIVGLFGLLLLAAGVIKFPSPGG